MIEDQVLTERDLVPFISTYLSEGYRKDALEFTQVSATEGEIMGSVSVRFEHVPSDGSFHFTAPLAFVSVAQLGIIYGCLDNGLNRKTGEIYLRSFNISCKRVIRDTLVPIVLRLTSRRSVKNGCLYLGKFDVADSAFVGSASFIMPLDEQRENQ